MARIDLPTQGGDLARCKVHEPNDDWPDKIEVRAIWMPANGVGRPKVKITHIDADQFFGRGHHGAPMSGDQLIGVIERLRKS